MGMSYKQYKFQKLGTKVILLSRKKKGKRNERQYFMKMFC